MGMQMVLKNTPVVAAAISWLIAQVIKVILTFIQHEKLDLSRLYDSGGMPSSHSSLVMALSFSLGKYYGFDSAYFAISIIFGMVVMYDAAGVRYAAGKQAKAINFLFTHHGMKLEEQLKELLGHTPLQVFVGGVLGIIVGLTF